MAKKEDFFIHENEILFVPDEDYAHMELYIQFLDAFSRISNKSIYVIDILPFIGKVFQSRACRLYHKYQPAPTEIIGVDDWDIVLLAPFIKNKWDIRLKIQCVYGNILFFNQFFYIAGINKCIYCRNVSIWIDTQ